MHGQCRVRDPSAVTMALLPAHWDLPPLLALLPVPGAGVFLTGVRGHVLLSCDATFSLWLGEQGDRRACELSSEVPFAWSEAQKEQPDVAARLSEMGTETGGRGAHDGSVAEHSVLTMCPCPCPLPMG